MFYKVKCNMLFEILIRTTFWFLFLMLDHMDPFIRQIQEQELWKYKYPATPSYISPTKLWIIIFILPTVLFITEYAVTKNKDDLLSACLGVTLSYSLTGFFTSFLKVIVGRPRPDFFYRCFPDGQGTDFTKCTGIRKSYMDGRKSFPSGHSSFVFACMVFITLYIARKFDLFDNYARKSWQFCVCVIPLAIAIGVAASRTCDYHHHYEDVIAGGLLGTAVSSICYKLYLSKQAQ